MRYLVLLFSALFCMGSLSAIQAGQPCAIDPANGRVGLLRTGMTVNEARKAIQNDGNWTFVSGWDPSAERTRYEVKDRYKKTILSVGMDESERVNTIVMLTGDCALDNGLRVGMKAPELVKLEAYYQPPDGDSTAGFLYFHGMPVGHLEVMVTDEKLDVERVRKWYVPDRGIPATRLPADFAVVSIIVSR